MHICSRNEIWISQFPTPLCWEQKNGGALISTFWHLLSSITEQTRETGKKESVCWWWKDQPVSRASFVFYLVEERKRRICRNSVEPLKSPKPNFRLANLVFSRQTGLFECEHPFIDKSMVVTDPTIPSARLLVLGWKMYLSNIQGTLNKDHTRCMKSLSHPRRPRG